MASSVTSLCAQLIIITVYKCQRLELDTTQMLGFSTNFPICLLLTVYFVLPFKKFLQSSSFTKAKMMTKSILQLHKDC